MGWRDVSLEIVIAIIGSSLLGTSLTTYYNNVYYQPYIDISVKENQNEKLLDRPDYYEITFKNTGEKSASNLRINIFFFANISNYAPIIHGEKPIFNLDNNTSQNNNDLIKPSLLNASLSKLPKNDIIILYVWTDPWSINNERFTSKDEYYITATYEEGSNYIASFNKKNLNDLNSFFPHVEVNTSDTLSIENIPFVTILLSIFTFAILVKVHRTKIRNKLLNLNRLDYYQNNKELNTFQYDLLVLLPIIFISSTIILFTIEIPLQKLIYSFLPPSVLTTYNPITIGIDISEDRGIPLYLILIFFVFGFLIILIIRCIVTYIICMFILKYVVNDNIDISLRLINDKHKKLSLLSLIIMSFPIYTIIYYSFGNSFSYNNLIYAMIITEFIRLTFLLILNKLSLDKNILIKNLIITSRIFCIISGLLYISISIIIISKILDIYSINIPPTLEFYSFFISDIFSIFNDKGIIPIVFSLLFFFIIGIIQIAWAYFLRRKTNGILYSLEFSGLVILTIMLISLRVFLPIVIATPANAITINYFAFLDVASLILNIVTIILSLQLLSIVIDYLIIKRQSILLKIKKSRITNPKRIISVLFIIIVLVLVPIIFFIPPLTSSIFSGYFFLPELVNLSPLSLESQFAADRLQLIEFDPIDRFFYFNPPDFLSDAYTHKSKDCITKIFPYDVFNYKCVESDIMLMDIDAMKRELILLLRNNTDQQFSIGVINLIDDSISNFNKSSIKDLNPLILYDMKIDPNKNIMYILHGQDFYDYIITEVNMNTSQIIDSSNLTSISKNIDISSIDFVNKKIDIDFVNKKIFLINSKGRELDIIDMETKKQLSHLDLKGVPMDIEYDYNNRKLYLSITNEFKTYVYIIEPNLFQILNKIEVKGLPLKIGITNFMNSRDIILLLTKGPNGVREYTLDEFGNVKYSSFTIPDVPFYIESNSGIRTLFNY